MRKNKTIIIIKLVQRVIQFKHLNTYLISQSLVVDETYSKFTDNMLRSST
jgi:hypothetical protein